MANNPYTQIDPFTEVLQALWALLEASTRFKALVKEHNRIKIDAGSAKSQKDKHASADFPQVFIEPAGNELSMSASSNSVKVVQRYKVALDDGDKRPTEKFFPLKWIVFLILANTTGNLGLNYVKNIELEDVSDSPDSERHPGWTAEFFVNVEMYFEKTDMKSAA